MPSYFSEQAQKLGVRELQTVKYHAQEAWNRWRFRKRVGLWLSVVAYAAAVVASESLPLAVAGGVILLTFRLWSIESELQYRMVFASDLTLELHEHTVEVLDVLSRNVLTERR